MAEILNLGENFKDTQYPQLRQVFSAAKLKHSKIINQAGKYQYKLKMRRHGHKLTPTHLHGYTSTSE